MNDLQRVEIFKAIEKAIRYNMPVDLMGDRMNEYARIWARAATTRVVEIIEAAAVTDVHIPGMTEVDVSDFSERSVGVAWAEVILSTHEHARYFVGPAVTA